MTAAELATGKADRLALLLLEIDRLIRELGQLRDELAALAKPAQVLRDEHDLERIAQQIMDGIKAMEERSVLWALPEK